MTSNEWKPVKGFEKEYLISETGSVKSISRKRINTIGRQYTNTETTMTQFIDRGGYWTVKLTKNKKYGTKYLHRLLALTFIDNPNNYPVVNHINGNKLDNSLENLEWVTRSQNQKHAILNNLAKIPSESKIKLYDMCTGRTFPSMKAACKEYRIEYNRFKRMMKNEVYNFTCLRYAA